jgi:hypothetical protein
MSISVEEMPPTANARGMAEMHGTGKSTTEMHSASTEEMASPEMHSTSVAASAETHSAPVATPAEMHSTPAEVHAAAMAALAMGGICRRRQQDHENNRSKPGVHHSLPPSLELRTPSVMKRKGQREVPR